MWRWQCLQRMSSAARTVSAASATAGKPGAASGMAAIKQLQVTNQAAALSTMRHMTALQRQLCMNSTRPATTTPSPATLTTSAPTTPISTTDDTSMGYEIIAKPPERGSGLPTYEQLIRFPVPSGIPTDKSGIYDTKDSSRDFRDIPGSDCYFVVHGPEKLWAPRGLVEGHGACGNLFAILAAAGRQFHVSPGDVMYTTRIAGEVNAPHVFEDVLLLGAVDWSIFGRPCIRGATVHARIEEQARSGKIYIERFKKRTGYRRRVGHRQGITRFRIEEIRYTMPAAERFTEADLGFDPHSTERNFWFKM